MRFIRTLCISLGGLVWLACATTPPPANSNGTMIAIAIPIDYRWNLDPWATGVNFVRLDDPIASGQIVSSNFFDGRYVYLLNAVPGRYTVVTASFVMDTTLITIYAPARLSEEIASTVSAGEILFLGEVILDDRGDWRDADETQLRYLDQLRHRHPFFGTMGAHAASARYEIDRGPVARQRFLESARSSFAGTEWASHFAHSVAAPAPSGE